MVLNLLRAVLKWQRLTALFAVSFFLTVSIVAGSGEPNSVSSKAQISSEDVAKISVPTTLEQVQSSGQVKVAVPSDFPPFGFVNPRMQPIGYDIDMATEIAKDRGLNKRVSMADNN